MKKILVVFGTRPEIIKLAQVIEELKKRKSFKIFTCSTGQHKEMLNQMEEIFNLNADYNLNLMTPDQNLFDLTSDALQKLKKLIAEVSPDLLIIQGDTTTAFAAALSAFYNKIKVAHVEAGLRSWNNYSPYPEEVNRKIISTISNIHFAPTKNAKDNLVNEGVSTKNIWVTGNTVIDALLKIKEELDKPLTSAKIKMKLKNLLPEDFFEKKFILITIHRREKFGENLVKILRTLKELAFEKKEYNFVYPVHMNPNIKLPVSEVLSGIPNFYLIPPQDYLSFIYLMKHCHFIISDSGGIQEECYVFRKPIIVLRDVTEREEAIESGYAFLAGNSSSQLKKIFYNVDKKLGKNLSFFKVKNPFGNGKAAIKIADTTEKYLSKL